MKKYILNSIESRDSIKEYISELDDMSFAINNLTWELQPVQLQLISESSNKMLQAIELLQQALKVPPKLEIKYYE